MFKFRSFRAKLLTLFLVAVATTQVATYFLVDAINQREARTEIIEDLRVAAIAFQRVTSERISLIATSATAVASDYAFRQNYLEFIEDPQTLQSAFESASARIDADLNAWVALDGVTITATNEAAPDDFTATVLRADESVEARAFGYVEIKGELYAIVAVPIRAPAIVAWWVVGSRVDQTLALTLRDMTAVDVSFSNSAHQVVASSLPPATRASLANALSILPADPNTIHSLDLAGESSLVNILPTRLESGATFATTLQFSLDEKLAPADRLSRLILLITAGGLVLAGILGLGFARRLSHPIQALAAHTRVIASGDYSTRLELNRHDELGDLAHSFNDMSSGLAERDQVRDLLDKNVSPEVAAQLMRSGSAIGGEERTLTVLFADLRGFTTLSENLPARDVVTLLNRYLDRMSQAIEAEGGVIDKFIGDEIMALFGAPVPAENCAHRAITAALNMRHELARLNAELETEGHAPLAFGIGINTAPVIAGNIGSSRRLNYSVIGDGVNLAARLQTLTRNPEFATDLIVSAATLSAASIHSSYLTRDLGPVTVKGRTQTVHIYAIEGAQSSV
jgi:adenylate cyclase